MIEEIYAAIRDELRWLMNLHSLVPGAEAGALAPSFKREQAEAMLRVEVGLEVEATLRDYLWAKGFQHMGPDQPWSIQGVSFYPTPWLKPDQWRIINPMRPRAADIRTS